MADTPGEATTNDVTSGNRAALSDSIAALKGTFLIMHNAIQPLERRRLLSSIIAMYTYAGDANLDGTISADDYGVIDNALGGGSGGFVAEGFPRRPA